ncbi:MAG: hypothetical protein ACJAQS_000781 [Porticoccus sp.]|jgi:hypothetical protein
MVLKKDKEKVLDEVWTEERVESFLQVEPPAGVDRDFHRLHKAYQSMRADNFESFVAMFIADSGNINATNPEGETVLAIASEHRNSGAQIAILTAA